jgi:transcriptional regulator with XRE-family HTH domain
MIATTQHTDESEVHLGRNVHRVRNLIGMKQSTLAQKTNMSQQNISRLEQSAYIPDETLDVLAHGLGVTVEFIKNFNDERAVYNIQNNFDTSSNHQNYQPSIYYEPVEKLTALYEKQLQNAKERETILEQRIETLEKIIEQLKNEQPKNN